MVEDAMSLIQLFSKWNPSRLKEVGQKSKQQLLKMASQYYRVTKYLIQIYMHFPNWFHMGKILFQRLVAPYDGDTFGP